MRIFHCTHCENLIFFENSVCLSCQHALAYLPERGVLAAFEPETGVERDAGVVWLVGPHGRTEQSHRLCSNYAAHAVCNWAIPVEDPQVLCQSCRLTRIIPDLSISGNREAWYRLEVAKRRLIYSLLELGLPLLKRGADDPCGLEFDFLGDSTQPNGDISRVLTGHENGVIRINVAEADDVERERQRQRHREPYRTLLGHFRHEIGHYYWDKLLRSGARLEGFRQLFGDERNDYAQALERHYREGAPSDWETSYISAYATTHPWEDWAETWAHFLHMCDALETAGAVGLRLKPRRQDEPSLSVPSLPLRPGVRDFSGTIEDWLGVTYVLNSLNRGLGLSDGYPFVLTQKVIDKLRFVHDTVVEAAAGVGQ